MIKTLTLENFKNFRKATLKVGELTVLVGTNASGKSNVRDAFRFLHGIARGYTLAEIVGEKWIDGGVLQWRGIRGGIREIAYRGRDAFSIQADLSTGETYRIAVKSAHPPGLRIVSESLHAGRKAVFHSGDSSRLREIEPADFLSVSLPRSKLNGAYKHKLRFSSAQPVLTQIASSDEVSPAVKVRARQVIDSLGSMRFLDLAPDVMRQPSLPGQTVLGDRGENLSSVLQVITAGRSLKNALLEWIKELTPLDVADFEFIADQTGRVLVTLVESDGQRTSAYSASDGTLRFLAMISALLAPSAARFYFFEELENGIHAARLYLLLQLIEQHVCSGTIQVVATSHSSQLLGILGKKARESAALVYRLSGSPDAQITRILDIPEARRVLEEQDLERLYASGWLEDAVSFHETANGNGRDAAIGGSS